jgi:hypothetical protein
MPIGKNSLKRVTNNGYTKVKSEAPDMEMSNIIANPDPQVMELAIKMAEPKEEKKPTAKKQPARKAPAKPKAAKTSAPQAKPEEKVINEKDGFAYTNLGEDLPYYLL